MSARARKTAPRLQVLASALWLAASAGGCEGGGDTGSEAPAQRPVAPSAAPVDRLAPDELGASKHSAHGLALPRGMRLATRSGNSIHAVGKLPAPKVEQYLRQHVRAASIELVGSKTIFHQAKFSGAEPGRSYEVELERLGYGRSKIVVRDTTKEKAEPGLSEEERWRQAGLTPDGKLLNPSALE